MSTSTDPSSLNGIPFLSNLGETAAEVPASGRRRASSGGIPEGVRAHLLGGVADPEVVDELEESLVAGVRVNRELAGPEGGFGGGISREDPLAHVRASETLAERFWPLVDQLRGEVAQRLQDEGITVRSAAANKAQESKAQQLIADTVSSHLQEQVAMGGQAAGWSDDYRSRVQEAVFDGIFRLGRYQRFVENPRVQNVHVNGFDNVWMELDDGSWEKSGPVASSDEALMQDIQQFSISSGDEGRPFSAMHPDLDMDLLGFVRLAAVAPPIAKRPTMVLRIHRYVDITLDDLVKMHFLTQDAADFLSAAVASGANIVISGPPGAGKTTLMRALARCVPSTEQVVTIEEDRELHLGMVLREGPPPIELQARPGSGELDASGKPLGAYDTTKAFRKALRLNSVRIFVGEARGDEVVAMIMAMQSGAGTFSTVHARKSIEAIGRLAGMGSKHFSEDYLKRELGELIDLVIQVERPRTGEDKGLRRISEITEIIPDADGRTGVAGQTLFALKNRRLEPKLRPAQEHFADQLEQQGADLSIFRKEADYES